MFISKRLKLDKMFSTFICWVGMNTHVHDSANLRPINNEPYTQNTILVLWIMI